MESAFELTLVALLNLRTMDSASPFPAVRYSNALSVIYLIFMSVLLCSLVVLYCLNFEKLKDNEFSSKFGSGYEGTSVIKIVYPRSIIAHPILFFCRRILFAFCAV